jgi:hypothetical protein
MIYLLTLHMQQHLGYSPGRNPSSAMPPVSCTDGPAPALPGVRGTPPTGR